ncbi:hypothetical protein E4T44_05933 [Aureobasidium sp. EXF-8845]|nr:hypothetical protein E4T44_05933 [Aureobasidium sp. EXF-8845]KAI4849302.1 hypothetical protein E4T45_05966 [Aureobasidium sp. EXF-8846]
MGPSSGKQVGQTFVQRLLEKGDIHPAVAVLLGFGEHDDAIEVYVSRGYFMEATLLTCLTMPSDWQRQSYLVRKWGEASVMQGQPELGVRCFSCTSLETSDSWSSPRAQRAAFSSLRDQSIGPSPLSPPLSPPFAVSSNRKLTRNGSLKLITTFGDNSLVLPSIDQRTPMAGMLGVGVTPIAESAISPGGAAPWLRSGSRFDRDPSSARTATPGGYARRQLPSRSGTSRTRDTSQTPLTAHREMSEPSPVTEASDPKRHGHTRKASSVGTSERSQNLDQTIRRPSQQDRLPSPSNDVFARLKSETRTRNGSRERTQGDLHVQVFDTTYLPAQPSQTHSASSLHLDPFTDSRQNRNDHPSNMSDYRGRSAKRYIGPPKKSPSSPIPMSPDEVMASRAIAAVVATNTDESYYRESTSQRKTSNASRTPGAESQAPSRLRDTSQVDLRLAVHSRDKSESRTPARPFTRSPSVPATTTSDSAFARSESRQRLQVSRTRAASTKDDIGTRTDADTVSNYPSKSLDEDSSASENQHEGVVRPRDLQSLTKKQLAARELEERRASLARRPSAPAIPLPSDVKTPPRRPFMAPRHHTESGNTPSSFSAPHSAGPITRSHTADPESNGRFPLTKITGTSTPTAPIGLPATPRAMRHPRYMSADPNEQEGVPAVPQVPESPPRLNSATFQLVSSSPKSVEDDQIAPLLPSTVFGQLIPLSLPRSSSAPPEMNLDGTPWHYKTVLPHSSRRGSITKGTHVRKVTPTENSLQPQPSPSSSRPSIDQTLHDAQIIIVEDDELMLPELQHLAGPPPPPPPPFMVNRRGSGLGVINIAIGEEEPIVIDVLPTIDRAGALTAPPLNQYAQAQAHAQMQAQAQRRGRGSISEGFNSRFRSVTERIRNNSKSRTKSPPIDAHAPSPYETVLPGMFSRQQSLPDNNTNRANSPYEASPIVASAAASEASLSLMPPPPPPPPAPPASIDQSSQGYPHPREVRANTPSETLLSPAVYQSDNMF